MKYLILLGLLLLLLGLFIYWRLRPYIGVARRIYDLFRNARSMTFNGATPSAARAESRAAQERLVRCAACGTWLPASRALSPVSASATYCSQACLAGRRDQKAAAE